MSQMAHGKSLTTSTCSPDSLYLYLNCVNSSGCPEKKQLEIMAPGRQIEFLPDSRFWCLLHTHGLFNRSINSPELSISVSLQDLPLTLMETNYGKHKILKKKNPRLILWRSCGFEGGCMCVFVCVCTCVCAQVHACSGSLWLSQEGTIGLFPTVVSYGDISHLQDWSCT